MKTLKTLVATCLVGTALVATAAIASQGKNEKGRGTGPTVFVISQDLYYDSIVVVSPEKGLPMKGDFQQLIPTMHGLETQYGPGEVGHLGGRWWIDHTMDGIMNEGDAFFLCPLLGPGRVEM